MPYDPNLLRIEMLPIGQQQGQAQNNAKHDTMPEPAPFTIIQSFATRLRYNQSKNETPIVLDSPIHTTRQGFPAVLLEKEDYNIKLAESCKHTLMGKFTNTMPKMEIIRKSFTLQTQLTGGVKINHYNSRHVYIDLDNEFDYVTVWTKQRTSIEGQLMRIQAWTPDFTPEEETPIVPIWVALPKLPWYCYKYLDSPSSQNTRGSMARVKIQIDLTKERPPHVWVGFKNSDPNNGRWQKIQYEGIPDYQICTIKKRDEDFKKEERNGGQNKNKNKGEQEKGATISSKKRLQTGWNHRQAQGKNQATGQQQTTAPQVQAQQEQEIGNQEEHRIKKKQNVKPEQSNPGSLETELQDTNNVAEGNNNRTPGIDSILPSPQPLDNLVVDVDEEAVGGTEGRDGVSKGKRELTHVLHAEEVQELTEQQGLSLAEVGNSNAKTTRPPLAITRCASGFITRSQISTPSSLERLQTKKMHGLSMIAILEPFANNSHLNLSELIFNEPC
ncbi:hypothetical protein H5410_003131, partial [Solanum commersonii]